MSESDVIQKVLAELHHAEFLHPNWPDDTIHAAAIVAEESGELVRAALQHTYEEGSAAALESEAIQTAAMAIRFLKELKK